MTQRNPHQVVQSKAQVQLTEILLFLKATTVLTPLAQKPGYSLLRIIFMEAKHISSCVKAYIYPTWRNKREQGTAELTPHSKVNLSHFHQPHTPWGKQILFCFCLWWGISVCSQTNESCRKVLKPITTSRSSNWELLVNREGFGDC